MPTSNTGEQTLATPGHPPLAVTMGDPEGIGLDIALSAWRDRTRLQLPPFVLYAEPDSACARARQLGIDAPLVPCARPREAAHTFATAVPIMAIEPRAGENSSLRAIEQATADVANGAALALVTNPISKSKPGFAALPYPGHTEYLADLAQRYCGCARPHPVMMLACETLRVVPTTVHIPLARVPQALTAALLRITIETTHAALVSDFGVVRPRIAVAGLNPHAGENGLIGDEEARLIAPVLEDLRRRGFDLAGPLSADTLFHAEARAGYDAAVAMYHDQALIPIKTIAFDTGVNITLGLPFVRTSPDHGTAPALAGTGRARPDSFIAALRLAQAMAVRRLRNARQAPA